MRIIINTKYTGLLFAALALAVLTCLLAAPVRSDTYSAKHRSVFLNLESSEELIEVFAWLIVESSENNSKLLEEDLSQLRPKVHELSAKANRLAGKNWELEIKLPDEDYPGKLKIAAYARTISGRYLSVPLREIGQQFTKLPEESVICKYDKVSSRFEDLLQLEPKKLEKLIALRQKRAGVMKRRLEQVLTPSVIDRLNSLEKSYGIVHSKEIGEETEIEELAVRISAISLIKPAAFSRQVFQDK